MPDERPIIICIYPQRVREAVSYVGQVIALFLTFVLLFLAGGEWMAM